MLARLAFVFDVATSGDSALLTTAALGPAGLVELGISTHVWHVLTVKEGAAQSGSRPRKVERSQAHHASFPAHCDAVEEKHAELCTSVCESSSRDAHSLHMPGRATLLIPLVPTPKRIITASARVKYLAHVRAKCSFTSEHCCICALAAYAETHSGHHGHERR
eukprot:360688-Chlamydomonas_euryale.AAC.1